MISLVLLGPPGAGKGTQAGRLARDFNLVHISAGDLLRAEVDAGTDLGKIAGPVMATGALIPDDLVVHAIAKRISRPDCAGGILFDGFPRTVGQAQALDALLNGMGRPVNAVIELQADEATLIGRMKARAAAAIAQGEAPRKDDNITTFTNRLAVYQSQSSLTIPFYAAQGLLDSVDAMQSIEDTARAVRQVMVARGHVPSVAVLIQSAPNNPGAAPTPI